MFNFLNKIGMFGLPLVITALFILYLTVKYSLKLFGTNSEPPADIHNIIFLGIFALALGLFSHYFGLYQATAIMAQLSPGQIAAGYGQSLQALLYGFGIFFISAIAWFVLRLRLIKLKLEAA